MCGIAGLVTKNPISRSLMTTAVDSLSHRGPDSYGIEIKERFWGPWSLGLAHTRLSILGLGSEGSQPMVSACGRYSIVFNGEVYNFKALRKRYLSDINLRSSSDTEVVLELFAKIRAESFGLFKGMFSICIVDLREGKVFLARDRFGVKPLYVSAQSDGIFFGSELKAIFTLGIDRKYKISSASLTGFLQYGYVPGNGSIVETVDKVPPGGVLEIAFSDTVPIFKRTNYWKPEDLLIRYDKKVTFNKKQIRGIFRKTIKSRLVSDVPVGVFLSGGYDSSLVAAMIKNEKISLEHYTIGFNQRDLDESNYSKNVAQSLGLVHKIEQCDDGDLRNIIQDSSYFFDEPFGDPSSIPTMQLCRMASKNLKVVLSADGGDEIFAGYDKHRWALQMHKLANSQARVFIRLARYLLNIFYRKPLAPLLGKKLSRYAKVLDIIAKHQSIEAILMETQKYITDYQIGDYLKEPDFNYAKYNILGSEFSVVDRMIVCDVSTHLPNQIMVKVDRSSMANSLEGREPLLDESLLKLSLQVADGQKIDKNGGKRLLKRLVWEFLPKNLMERPKQGFVPPIRSWLLGPLRPLLDDLVSPEKLDPEIFCVSSILLMKERFLRGENNLERRLWHVLIFQLWREKWGNYLK